MEEREAIELIWQDFATNMIVPDLDLLGVLAAAPYNPSNLSVARMTEWLEYQFSR
jgi:hypothetical protein